MTNLKKRPKKKVLSRKILKTQKGQALIEFILFFPFLLMMYSVSLSIANSINASINQQKVTRGYFYFRLQNNSTLPTPFRGEPPNNWTRFGHQINLWGEKLLDDKPLAACFKFNVPLGEAQDDTCENSYSNRTTQYIRVGTVYGVCGATYVKTQTEVVRLPNFFNGVAPGQVVAANNCHIE
ncbi:MAG: hypothetical protein WD025_05610 [Bacteriovoracaceae bacterium]